MTDRRLLRFNGRVAHQSLRGTVDADTYTDGKRCVVTAPVADLCAEPGGARDRQLLRGAVFVDLDHEPGWVFGYAERDGYVGWVEMMDLYNPPLDPATHRIAVARSYGKTTPGLKVMGRVLPLPYGAVLPVTGGDDAWAQIAWRSGGVTDEVLFVPRQHLAPRDQREPDPVAVAERLLGTPYLWGGNSSFGIDCSGLVQIACHACGIDCPGDSDQQQAHFPAAPDATYQRGDLLFWRGHVAWVVDAHTLIHANAHHMAVAHEPIAAAIARIAAQGDGPVTHHARPPLHLAK